jgi:hypothetical protein
MMAGEPMLRLTSNQDDVAKAEAYLRARTNGELIQIINSPIALEGKLEGFTRNMLRTADERVIVDLTKEVLAQRTTRRMLRVSWLALGVSGVSALAAVASAIAAVVAKHP